MGNPVPFGYNRGLPDSVETAWGARTIAYADWLDLLHDRQGTNDGPRKDELLDYLTEHVPFKDISAQAPKVTGTSDDVIVFFEDDNVIVKGSAQRSSGYCYLIAYFKDDVDPAVDAAASLSPDALLEAAQNALALDHPCEWFALCDNAATGTLDHPILGQVPICDRCRAKVEALS